MIPTRGDKKEARTMYTCPHCGQKTIAFRQMIWVTHLGRSATCGRCGKASGLPGLLRSLYLAIALLFGIGVGVFCLSILPVADTSGVPVVATSPSPSRRRSPACSSAPRAVCGGNNLNAGEGRRARAATGVWPWRPPNGVLETFHESITSSGDPAAGGRHGGGRPPGSVVPPERQAQDKDVNNLREMALGMKGYSQYEGHGNMIPQAIVRQGRQAAAELAGGPTAVHRTGQPLPEVHAGRTLGRAAQQGPAGGHAAPVRIAAEDNKPGETFYQVFTGPDTAFPDPSKGTPPYAPGPTDCSSSRQPTACPGPNRRT